MAVNVTNNLVNSRKNQYINKTFEDFRNELIGYARQNFSNQIQDFSESSLGGMFLDFAAIVGDSLTFYVDQQFNELNYETATNTRNIISHLRRAGIKGGNASPSSVYVTFYIEVDIDESKNIRLLEPLREQLPVIKKGTELTTGSVDFILTEDVDFSSGYKKTISDLDEEGLPLTLILEKEGLCTSGNITSESITFGNVDDESFLSYRLNNVNIQRIIRVVDNDSNEYYEVDYLSQDTVHLKVENSNEDFLYPTPAPFRYIIENNFQDNTSFLRFGNGNGKTIQDNLLSNPEDLILPLENRNYNQKISLDPNMLLKSNSLGVSPRGKTLNITYLHGGGLNHNVAARSINKVKNSIIVLPHLEDSNEKIDEVLQVIEDTLDVTNQKEAVGGTERLSLEDLVALIPQANASQNRVVNEKDLISRIYTMPSDYGKVHKIAILNNQYTHLSKDLFVICKDQTNNYTYANDALKKNLKNYINEFRVLGDSFNILDAPIYNFGIDLTIKIKKNNIIENVLDSVISRIIQNMKFEKMQINEAVNINDIINIVLNTDGVSSIVTLPENIIISKSFQDNFYDEVEDITIDYSRNMFSPKQDFLDGFIFPNRGGIFELKYLNYDIVVRNG